MAHALGRLEYEVTVFERSADLRTEGAGISLWPNATAALEALDLGDVAADSSHVIAGASLKTPKGGGLSDVPLRGIAERYGPLVAVHRADLLQGLFERAQATASVEFEAEATISEGALFVDGARIDCDLVVGADGVQSIVSRLVAPGARARSAGYGAWRGIATHDDEALASNVATETIGRGRRIGLVPLGRRRTYWFAVIAGDDGSADLQGAFAGWHRPIGEVLADTPEGDRSYLELYEVPPLATWHRGNMVLVGDAAHAMTPNLGQGAAQALQDVAVLSRELETVDTGSAFSRYERMRKKPAERIVKQSRRLGRLVQASHPLSAKLRDSLLRSTPGALTAWNLERVLRP